MAFTAPAQAFEERKPIPAGLVAARCYMMADLGKQKDSWQGKPKVVHKMWLSFEIPKYRFEFTDANGQEKIGPSVLGFELMVSMSEKANLRKHIEAWFSKKFPSDEAASSFDLEKLIGKTCMINVVHSKCGKYANIGSFAPPMDGMEIPPAELEPLVYTDGSAETLAKLPKFIQEKISAQVSDQTLPQDTAHQTPPSGTVDANGFDDDIPF